MSAKHKSWREKLADSKGLPRTAKIEGKLSKKWGAGTMVIPSPMQVDAVMKKVPRGKLITINEIRQQLAKQHGVNVCCPITTGIFAWIAAHAAEEAAKAGSKRVTPWWRTLKTGGELNPKYPGGIKAMRRKLKSEGHELFTRGQRTFVTNYADRLVT